MVERDHRIFQFCGHDVALPVGKDLCWVGELREVARRWEEEGDEGTRQREDKGTSKQRPSTSQEVVMKDGSISLDRAVMDIDVCRVNATAALQGFGTD